MGEIITKQETAVQIEQSSSIESRILDLASNPDFDAEKLRSLIEMQAAMLETQSKQAFNRALIEFKANPPAIIKNKSVAFGNTKYSHATIDSVQKTLDPILYKLGISFRWKTDSNAETGIVRVSCILAHIDGYSEESSMEGIIDKSGGKNITQGAGSTITYLKRYTLLAALGLAEEGQDDDATGRSIEPEKINQDQINEIEGLMSEFGISAKDVCQNVNAKSIHEMTLKQYRDTIKTFENTVKK